MDVRASLLSGNRTDIDRAVNMLAWPAAAEQIMMTGTMMVQTMMVARLGAEVVAGMGTATQVLMTATAGFAGMGVGTTALVARFVGAAQPRKANHAAKQSV